MPVLDPAQLSALPAPLWFITLFKIIGFVLHLLAMNLWLVGLPLALLLYLCGGANGRTFARRLLKQMPIIMALGVNFGIVPLLFVQTAWYKPFYTSTILLAVHWFAILLLVMVGYYALYACSHLVDKEAARWKVWLCGTIPVLCLTASGLIFASVWTFMACPDAWPAVWEKTFASGAVSGLGTFWRNPQVFVRFGIVAGLALLTTGFWTLFDARFLMVSGGSSEGAVTSGAKSAAPRPVQQSVPKLSKKEKKRRRMQGLEDDDFDEEYAALEAEEKAQQEAKSKSHPAPAGSNYESWSLRFATSLIWLGALAAGGLTWYYYFVQLDSKALTLTWLYSSPWKWLLWGTICAPLLTAGLATLGQWGKLSRSPLVLAITLSHLTTLAAYATTRQLVQNCQLASWWNVTVLPEATQWSPLYAFVGVFAFTLLVILWMIRQMARASKA
ncbi:MAG: hypothetical protein Q4G68_08595 [Planctomycetia bacterium]|nr:hypothetical protein [Planctomycetia bacterium]